MAGGIAIYFIDEKQLISTKKNMEIVIFRERKRLQSARPEFCEKNLDKLKLLEN